jgi:hypothetical protein
MVPVAAITVGPEDGVRVAHRAPEQRPTRVVEAGAQREVGCHRRRASGGRESRRLQYLGALARRVGEQAYRGVEGLVVEISKDEQALVPALFKRWPLGQPRRASGGEEVLFL